jgi:hypothetical protein
MELHDVNRAIDTVDGELRKKGFTREQLDQILREETTNR